VHSFSDPEWLRQNENKQTATGGASGGSERKASPLTLEEPKPDQVGTSSPLKALPLRSDCDDVLAQGAGVGIPGLVDVSLNVSLLLRFGFANQSMARRGFYSGCANAEEQGQVSCRLSCLCCLWRCLPCSAVAGCAAFGPRAEGGCQRSLCAGFRCWRLRTAALAQGL
jgi:hypothetical protein